MRMCETMSEIGGEGSTYETFGEKIRIKEQLLLQLKLREETTIEGTNRW